ncbi:MAG: hypothetical protein EGR94_08480, partial [Blautia obeum]|nr:hypothetical protein [Blautia obeum]
RQPTSLVISRHYCYKKFILLNDDSLKNFRESYVFHCLVIKVLCLSVSQTAHLLYHIHQCLSSTFFKFFSRHFLMSVCRSQATCLLYHISVPLSTTFMLFSKLFKLFNQKKQFLVTAQLEYHFPTELSTLFFIIYNYSS